MTPASHQPDLSRIGQCALVEVLNTFLSLPATVDDSASSDRPSTTPGTITSRVPLSSQQVSAEVYLHLPAAFLAMAVELLTGLNRDSQEATALQEDTAGELANMAAGRIAAQLAASGYPCRLGTPSVVRNAALPFTPETGVAHGRTNLLCQGHSLWLDIDCRYLVS